MVYLNRATPSNLENEISALPSVQAFPEIMTSNGCKVSLRFHPETDSQIRRDVAKMLLAAFARQRRETREKSIVPVQSIDEGSSGR